MNMFTFTGAGSKDVEKPQTALFDEPLQKGEYWISKETADTWAKQLKKLFLTLFMKLDNYSEKAQAKFCFNTNCCRLVREAKEKKKITCEEKGCKKCF